MVVCVLSHSNHRLKRGEKNGIKACTTMEELDAVEINYDPVLKQYLETVGLKEVTE